MARLVVVTVRGLGLEKEAIAPPGWMVSELRVTVTSANGIARRIQDDIYRAIQTGGEVARPDAGVAVVGRSGRARR